MASTPQKRAADAGEKTPRRPRSTQKFIRNLYSVPLSLRLESKKRIELKPRGMRGDLTPITKDEEKDGNMILNIGFTVEVLNEALARAVIEGQMTNAASAGPTTLSQLRDHLGREYEQTEVVIEARPEEQGHVVARLEDGQVVINRDNGRIERDGGHSVMPRVATVPGADREYQELLRGDDNAKNGTTIQDVLGHLTVE